MSENGQAHFKNLEADAANVFTYSILQTHKILQCLDKPEQLRHSKISDWKST